MKKRKLLKITIMKKGADKWIQHLTRDVHFKQGKRLEVEGPDGNEIYPADEIDWFEVEQTEGWE